MQPYSETFYKDQADASLRSARRIVPLLMEMVGPHSVLDLGCGVATWLQAFGEAGVETLQGVDGDYVERSRLRIPTDRFFAHDLTQPLSLDRQFDLVMSVEVAEHLPPEKADTFVASLVAHGSVIMFSAAAPYQGGAHHVNEQWPDYWAERFKRHGYVPVDAVRRRVWSDPDIMYWYRQNILLFVREADIERYPALLAERATTFEAQLNLVHPEAYLAEADLERWPLAKVRAVLPVLMQKAGSGIARKLLGR